jgi:uncharacterized protein (TIGR00730 family)
MATVCVFCCGKPDIPANFVADARRLGSRLASGGHDVVYGGGSTRMMGALADGAIAGGGRVRGVVPRRLIELERPVHNGCDLVVADSLAERKNLMLNGCDAIVVAPGGLGTLDELFEVWTQGPQIGIYHQPLILLNSSDFYSGLLTWLRACADAGMMHHHLLNSLLVAGSEDDVLAWIPAGFHVAEKPA